MRLIEYDTSSTEKDWNKTSQVLQRAPFKEISKPDFSVCAKNRDLNLGLNLLPGANF